MMHDRDRGCDISTITTLTDDHPGREWANHLGQKIINKVASIYSSQKVYDLFFLVALKKERPTTPLRLFHCQNKTNKVVSGQIW